MLIGEYKHTIDEKKRLAIPSKFRKELGKELVVTRGLEGCLFVYTEKEWKALSNKIGNLSITKTDARAFSRLMLSGASSMEIDKLGRVLLPDYLKNYAGLKKDVVICGLFNHLEIWDNSKWEEYKEKTEGKFEELAEKLTDSGI